MNAGSVQVSFATSWTALGNEFCTDGPPYQQIIHDYGLDAVRKLLS